MRTFLLFHPESYKNNSITFIGLPLNVSNCSDGTMLDMNCNCVSDGVMGCTDVCATNYNPSATVDDGTCTLPSPDDGCALTMDSLDPVTCAITNTPPNVDDGCDLTTDSFDATACMIINMPPDVDDGCPFTDDSFDAGTCQILNISNCATDTELDTATCMCVPVGGNGCIDVNACNYSSDATFDDGSCVFPGDTCDDGNPLTDNDTLQADCSCEGIDASNDCDIYSVGVDTYCDDMGTEEIDDDVFYFTLNPTGGNLGTSYSVTGDLTLPNIPYGVSPTAYGPFQSGSSFYIILTDDNDPNCTFSTTISYVCGGGGVPTVSEWGLIILALILLNLGVLYIRQTEIRIEEA